MQGQLEVPINARGRGQAGRNGRVLRELIGDGHGFDFVASPMLRTRQTMEIVRAEMGLPATGYRTDDRLREIHKGDWQSLLWLEICTRFPGEMAVYDAGRWTYCPPGEGAESFAALYARVCGWLAEVTRDTVVVSHGGPMRCIRRHVLGLDDAATMVLTAPQDQVMRISGGKVSWL